MRTEELIRHLAADPRPAPSVGRGVAITFMPALLVALAFLAGGWGIRTDLASALADPMTAMKLLLPALVALTAVAGTLRLAQPEGRVGGLGAVLVVLASIALGLVALSLMRTQPEAWGAAVRGRTLVECLLSIPTLAILPTLALLLSLRRGASLAPVLSGALAGLGGGAAAAAIFSLYCTADDPLFFVTWYGAAILATSAMGAVLGQRLLKW